MRELLRRQRLLGTLCVCWVLALLAVQSLGLVHRVLHASANTALSASSETEAKHAQAQGTPVLQGVWGEHSSRADCQLFDQACPDVLHTVGALWLTTPVLAMWSVLALPERLTQPRHFFSARGPPVQV